jgi:hypothetical protein
VVAAVALGAVAVVALSGGDDDTSTGLPAGVTLDDLEPALLTEDDVSNGFTLDESNDDSEDDPMDMEDLDASDECRDVMASIEAGDQDQDWIGVAFVDDVDATVDHVMSLVEPGPPTLNDVRDAIDQCGTVAFEEDGVRGEFSFDTSDVEGIGDEAVGVAITVDMEIEGLSFTVESYGVLWERDGVACNLGVFGGFDEVSMEALPVDTAWVRELAATADQRLAETLNG